MKAGIVGAGAMGCLFEFFFHRAGIDSALYESNRQMAHILKSSLNVRHGNIIEIIRPVIDSTPAVLQDSDIIFLFVKSYSTDIAVRDILHILRDDTILVSLQNGLGNREILLKHLPPERVVFGSTSIGAHKTDEITVVLGGMGETLLGGENPEAVGKVAALLEEAGLSVDQTDQAGRAIWKKVIINAGINPLGGVLNLENGKILGTPHAFQLQERIVREAVQAANREGMQLEEEEMLEATRDVCRRTSSNVCSMLQDIRAGRKTEIDSINGKIVESGETHGLDLPYNRTLWLLVKALESSRKKPSG